MRTLFNIKSMRYWYIVLILIFHNSSFCQNQSYQLYEDSIFPILEMGDYNLAKKKLLDYEKTMKFDPVYKLSFLEFSLTNKDIMYFKKEISYLIKNHGYYYNFSDTIGESLSIPINWSIRENGLAPWVSKTCQKLYPKWVKKHTEDVRYLNKLDQLRTADQQIRKSSFTLFPSVLNHTSDSVVIKSFTRTYDSLICVIDLENVIAIKNICLKNGGNLPTNFDSGFSISKKISLIITHNLKKGKNLKKTWEYLYYYVEKAYLEGKISSLLLYEYDYYLNSHFGYQYYGFLEDVPVIEPETFNERKIKFGL